jgi:hypothetical protein
LSAVSIVVQWVAKKGDEMAHNYEEWSRLRRMGRARFIVFFGVLGWGLPFGLLFPFLFALLARLVEPQGPTYLAIVGWMLPRMLPIGMLGGAVFGWWIWRSGEKGHQHWVEKQEGKHSDEQLDR